MPLTLDGRLDKPFWADIPFTELFVDIKGPEKRKPPRFPARAKAAWDDDALYLAAELTGDEIWAHVANRDGGKPMDSFDIKGLETAVYIDGKQNDPGADNRKWSEYWGFLFFTENGEEYPIPADERLRFDLYRLFEEQRVYCREHGCYTTDVDALCAAGVETRPVIETTARFFETR